MESQPTVPTGASALESADSEQESADSSAYANAYAAKVGVWVWAFRAVSIPHYI